MMLCMTFDMHFVVSMLLMLCFTAALEALSATDVSIDVDLHLGQAAATVWTCDLTYDYVRINGEYRS